MSFNLPSLGSPASLNSVVGFSAGGWKSMEMHVNFPEVFKGVGLFNSGGFATGPDYFDFELNLRMQKD